MKGIIFDLDGVLVDTARYHFQAWKRLADEMGINFTPDDNERFKGVSRMRCMDILEELGGLNLDTVLKNELASRKNAWYRELISEMNPEEILPGVLPLLGEIKVRKIPMALGSASKNARTILDKVGLTGYFHTIIDGTRVSAAKPDPEVFLKAAEGMGIVPEECMVLEDAKAGIEAALRAGMTAIGVGDAAILNNAALVFQDLSNIRLEDLEAAE